MRMKAVIGVDEKEVFFGCLFDEDELEWYVDYVYAEDGFNIVGYLDQHTLDMLAKDWHDTHDVRSIDSMDEALRFCF